MKTFIESSTEKIKKYELINKLLMIGLNKKEINKVKDLSVKSLEIIEEAMLRGVEFENISIDALKDEWKWNDYRLIK